MDGIQYIVNEEGEKKAVIIDLEKWGNLWQELSEKILNKSDDFEEKKGEWHDFIEQTYGCLADDPIVRYSQGEVNRIFYSLESLLSEGKWKEADEETTRLMLQLGDEENKGYLDDDDCENFPKEELRTIDKLWLKYSNGKFGFSRQKEIYLQVGGKLDSYDWDSSYIEMCDRIGWIKNNEWLSYSDLTFNITAPQGHLPLLCWGIGELWWGFFEKGHGRDGVSFLFLRL